MVCVCVGEEGGRIACRMMVGERGVALGVEGLMQAGCEYSGSAWKARAGGIAAENDIRKTLDRFAGISWLSQSYDMSIIGHNSQILPVWIVMVYATLLGDGRCRPHRVPRVAKNSGKFVTDSLFWARLRTPMTMIPKLNQRRNRDLVRVPVTFASQAQARAEAAAVVPSSRTRKGCPCLLHFWCWNSVRCRFGARACKDSFIRNYPTTENARAVMFASSLVTLAPCLL
jgi:hypothetical protein